MERDEIKRPALEPFESERPEYAADPREGSADDALVLDLDGFEGPIDLLLALSREQKVDLTKISILELADQYLAFIARARRLRLEIAADYLVMAAWLAYLKSRLLLPVAANSEEEASAAEMAARLAFQLQRLEAMRKAGEALLGRPSLGQDFYRRGAPEPIEVFRRPIFEISLYDLLRAYGMYQSRASAAMLRINPVELFSMERALQRLASLVGDVPDWTTLASFLPPDLQQGLMSKSALAATFAASLELVRTGKIVLRQGGAFEPIYLKSAGQASGR